MKSPEEVIKGTHCWATAVSSPSSSLSSTLFSLVPILLKKKREKKKGVKVQRLKWRQTVANLQTQRERWVHRNEFWKSANFGWSDVPLFTKLFDVDGKWSDLCYHFEIIFKLNKKSVIESTNGVQSKDSVDCRSPYLLFHALQDEHPRAGRETSSFFFKAHFYQQSHLGVPCGWNFLSRWAKSACYNCTASEQIIKLIPW